MLHQRCEQQRQHFIVMSSISSFLSIDSQSKESPLVALVMNAQSEFLSLNVFLFTLISWFWKSVKYFEKKKEKRKRKKERKKEGKCYIEKLYTIVPSDNVRPTSSATGHFVWCTFESYFKS